MAISYTLSQLRTRVRNLGDYASGSNGSFIQDDELDIYLNNGIRGLYDILIETEPSRFLTQTSISITANTADYNLPNDHFKTIGVDVLDGSDYFEMDRINWRERNISTNLYGDKRFAEYDIRGNKLKIFPTPNWTGTVRLNYIPVVYTLVNGNAGSLETGSFDFVQGWDEYVVYDALTKCVGKEEGDPSLWLNLRNDCEARIRRNAPLDVGRARKRISVNRHPLKWRIGR